MGIIHNKIKELSSDYTTLNILRFNEFLHTCESTEILEDFSSIIAEPSKGAQFAKEFTLMNTLSKADLETMKAKLESMLVKAQMEGYTNIDHIESIEDTLALVNSKLETVQESCIADLLIDSMYLQELAPVSESAIKDEKTLKAILSKDLPDEDKIKLANKFVNSLKTRTAPMNTAMDIANIATVTSLMLYSVTVVIPATLISILLPTPILIANVVIHTVGDMVVKRSYIRAFKSELKKIDAAMVSADHNEYLLMYKDNVIEAISTLENSKGKVALESVLESAISRDSLADTVKDLDMIMVENYYNFIFREDETVEESIQWFKNIVATYNVKSAIIEDTVLESKNYDTDEMSRDIRDLIHGLIHARNADERKKISMKAMNKASAIPQAKYVYRYVKSTSTNKRLGLYSVKDTIDLLSEKAREDNKKFRDWAYGPEFKKLYEKKIQSLSIKTESVGDYDIIEEGKVSNFVNAIPEVRTLQKTLLSTKDSKSKQSACIKAINNAKNTEELTYLYTFIKKNSVNATVGLKGTAFNGAIFTEEGRAENKKFKAWAHGEDLKSLVEKKKESLSVKKESCEFDEDFDLDDDCELDLDLDLDDDLDDFLLEGKNADEARKKVNVAANKVRTGAAKLKHKVKQSGQATKAALHQVDKTGKAMDDAATNAVNKAKNVYRNDVRGEIIESKTTIKFGRIIRKAIMVGSLVLVNPALGAIGALTTMALRKNVKAKERRKILRELEEELEIVNEKIEDSRGDENKEKKYQLMRIRNKLQKDITRVQYGLKADDKGV